MRKKIFINMKAFVLVLAYVLLMKIAHAMQPAGDPLALIDAQIDQIVQEADEIVRNDVITDEQMGQFDREIQAIIDDLAAQDPRPLGEFQNTVFAELPLGRASRVTEGGYHTYAPERWEQGHWEEARVIPGRLVAAHWENDIQDEDVRVRRYEPAHEENGVMIEGRWIEPGRYYRHNGGQWVEEHWEDERVEPRRWVDGRYVPGERVDVPRSEKVIQSVTQVTGHHFLQVMFMTARCGLDYAFLKQLKKYYFQNVLSDWETKTQQILEALICIEQDEEGELLWDNNAQKLVQEAFTTTFVPDEATTFKVIMLLGLYFLASECYRNVEHQTLSMPWTGLIDFATSQAKNIEQSGRDEKIVMPIPAMILYLVDTWGLGGESVVAENLPVVRNWALRFSGYYHEALNTYWFEAAKRSLILARFSMQTKSYFQAQTKLFVQNNKDKLCALASSLAQARSTNNQEIQKEVEARFKLFITQSYDYPFFQWLRFKGSCIFWTTIWTEMLLMLPAMIRGGKLLYEYVRP